MSMSKERRGASDGRIVPFQVFRGMRKEEKLSQGKKGDLKKKAQLGKDKSKGEGERDNRAELSLLLLLTAAIAQRPAMTVSDEY